MHVTIRKILLSLALSLAPWCAMPHPGFAQSGAPATNPAPGDTTPQPEKPSNLIAPAIDHLSQTVSQVRLEHWKGSSRDETDGNLRSVERNLSGTLPALVTAADADPNSVAAALPLLRNLDALCAVMIRVSVTARSNAPAPEAQSLAGALTALQSARNTLADQTLTLATAQEKQIALLNSRVTTLTARLNAPPPPPAPATTATKPRPKKKAAAKPAQPSAKPTQP